MALNFRKIHRQSAPIIFIPLLLTSLTGVGYRLGRSWFGLSGDVASVLKAIHKGGFLGETLMPFYVLLMGIGLIGMVVTGLMLVRRKRNPNRVSPKDQRWLHRALAIAGFVPLTISALTGIAYSLGESWFDLSPEASRVLMRLHQGSYLGPFLRVIYALLIGLCLVVLLVTGINMTGILRKHRAEPPASSS